MSTHGTPAAPTGLPWVVVGAGLAQLALLAVPLVVGLPGPVASLALGLGELLLVVGLGLTLVTGPSPGVAMAAYTLCVLAFAGLAIGVWQSVGRLWAGALALAVAVALVAYAIHRYQVVVTELLPADGEPP